MLTRILLVLVLLLPFTKCAELSRCCGGGTRHFSHTSTCSGIRSEGSTLACSRTASICCLRSLLDAACDQGTELARSDQSCPSNINVLGGGLKKECCDCCLLARELVRRNEPCVAPTGFAASCLRSFNKCCSTSVEITGERDNNAPLPLGDSKESGTIFHGDRCSSSRCEHLCNDRGGESVECSCKNGFDLAADGVSCVDRNECAARPSPCVSPVEECVNTQGAFFCKDTAIPLMRDSPHIVDLVRPARHDKRKKQRVLDDDVTRDLRPDESISRGVGCPKGWTHSNTSITCTDVDECNLGTHDCGPLYHCRNTQGSYRCDPKTCEKGQLQNPVTGECTRVDCPLGYEVVEGRCKDINECLTPGRCPPTNECLNTPGGFRCLQAGSFCSSGYELNPATGFCDDIDECGRPNACDGVPCTNLVGSFKCRCNPGFEFNEQTLQCEDVNECAKFVGHACDALASCHNTHGSFFCQCKEGFQLGSDGRSCVDVDECLSGSARCDQKCINTPGSYQCICDRGYALSPDGKHCNDIDECSLWTGSGTDLCMGSCINTPGSYKCNCPAGYLVESDGRTCQDVDECAAGECQGGDRICVNTLGGHKCHFISCPLHYTHDKNYKNRVEDGYSCIKSCPKGELACVSNHTKEILYQFRAIPTIQTLTQPIEVSKIRAQVGAPLSVQYTMDPRNRAHFMVEQQQFLGIVKLISPMTGPLEESVKVHIHVKSRSNVILYHNVAMITVNVSRNVF